MIEQQLVEVLCFNGPCEGSRVSAPVDATPGTACALPWKNVRGAPRYAVYVLVDFNGIAGLMHVRSYDRAIYAQNKVELMTRACAERIA